LLPWHLNGQLEIKLAYLIDPVFWGHGLTTEAATAIAEHAPTRLDLQRLVSLIDPQNTASQRVAEKIGISFEKEMEDEMGYFQNRKEK